LYKYRRHQDVRLVFAPESVIARWVGSRQLNFPRYALDIAFLRVWEKGADAAKPMATPDYFPWSQSGAQEGEPTFVIGNPWSTSRERTVAELAFSRDVDLPIRVTQFSELRGVLLQYQQMGKEQARTSKSLLFGVENGLKARKGMLDTLRDPAFWQHRKAPKARKRLRAGTAGHCRGILRRHCPSGSALSHHLPILLYARNGARILHRLV
jgi:hypothetical protein